jgi:hypothetical protein
MANSTALCAGSSPRLGQLTPASRFLYSRGWNRTRSGRVGTLFRLARPLKSRGRHSAAPNPAQEGGRHCRPAVVIVIVTGAPPTPPPAPSSVRGPRQVLPAPEPLHRRTGGPVREGGRPPGPAGVRRRLLVLVPHVSPAHERKNATRSCHGFPTTAFQLLRARSLPSCTLMHFDSPATATAFPPFNARAPRRSIAVPPRFLSLLAHLRERDPYRFTFATV